MTTGEKIQTIRVLRGLSRETMAEKLHLSVQGYGKIERGEVKLEERLSQIAEALGVSKEYIENFDSENLVQNVNSYDSSTNHNASAYQIIMSDGTAIEALTDRLKAIESHNEKLLALLERAQTQSETIQQQLIELLQSKAK